MFYCFIEVERGMQKPCSKYHNVLITFNAKLIMRKTVFSEDDNAKLILRLSNLQKGSVCAWGSMSVAGMLYHCNFTNKVILKAPPSLRKRTLKQRVLKFLVMDIKKEIPRGVKGNPKFFSQETDILNFEDQKAQWLDIIPKFTNVQGPLEGEHPIFGKLNTKEWGRFVWLHMDHHLRQFGV